MHRQLVEEAENVQIRRIDKGPSPDIDRNYIQEIESVAYEPPKIQVNLKAYVEELKEE